MTTTPNEPVSDDDIETTGGGLGSAAASGTTGPGDGTRDGAEGGPLDPQDEGDSDSGDSGDSDSGDSDSGDSGDSDSGDSDSGDTDADASDA